MMHKSDYPTNWGGKARRNWLMMTLKRTIMMVVMILKMVLMLMMVVMMVMMIKSQLWRCDCAGDLLKCTGDLPQSLSFQQPLQILMKSISGDGQIKICGMKDLKGKEALRYNNEISLWWTQYSHTVRNLIGPTHQWFCLLGGKLFLTRLCLSSRCCSERYFLLADPFY